VGIGDCAWSKDAVAIRKRMKEKQERRIVDSG
jgi:hypothetical protein